MELPLINPATPETAPPAVVKPQSEAFAHLAAAAGEAQHTAENIWYMNRMARQDHDLAWLNTASGKLAAANDSVKLDIMNGKLGPDEAGPEVRKRMAAAIQPILDQSSGPFKERLTSMLHEQSDVGAEQMTIHATAENLLRQNANYKASQKDLIDRIPFSDTVDQPKLISQLHQSIDEHGRINHLPDAEIQDEHDRANANVHLGLMEKAVNDAPGHALATLTSKDFDTNNPWMGMVGGEAAKQKLINAAMNSIKQGDAQVTAAFQEQRSKDLNQLMAMKNAGQQIPTSMLDNIHTISTPLKQFFNPTYHPEPPGDEGMTQEFLKRAGDVHDASDVQNLKLAVLGSNVLNARQRQEVSAAADSALKLNTSAIGQAYQGGLRDLKNQYDPPVTGAFSILPEERAHRKDIAARAQAELTAVVRSGGFTRPDQIATAVRNIKNEYDKYEVRLKQNRDEKTAAPPRLAPTSAKTLDDEHLVKTLGLK